jgi:hypothetical protein
MYGVSYLQGEGCDYTATPPRKPHPPWIYIHTSCVGAACLTGRGVGAQITDAVTEPAAGKAHVEALTSTVDGLGKQVCLRCSRQGAVHWSREVAKFEWVAPCTLWWATGQLVGVDNRVGVLDSKLDIVSAPCSPPCQVHARSVFLYWFL